MSVFAINFLFLNRFTEFYVNDVQNTEDLQLLIQRYLEGFSITASDISGIIRYHQALLLLCVC